MSETTFWLGRAAACSFACALVAAASALFGSRGAAGPRWVRRHVALLDQRLAFIRSRVRATQVLAAQTAASLACLAVVAFAGKWPLLLVLPAVALGPKALLDVRAARRVGKIEEQIEPWLGAIANSLKANPSLGEAIESTIALVPSPMSEEVDVLVKAYELGTPLDRALEHFAERAGSRTLAATVLALKVARRSGGNLPEMLESAAAALRELARLEGVVRTKTAEGKAQAFVIGVIPVPMIVGIHALDPAFFAPLVSNFLGNLIVAGAVLLWMIAIVASRKILAVDV